MRGAAGGASESTTATRSRHQSPPLVTTARFREVFVRPMWHVHVHPSGIPDTPHSKRKEKNAGSRLLSLPSTRHRTNRAQHSTGAHAPPRGAAHRTRAESRGSGTHNRRAMAVCRWGRWRLHAPATRRTPTRAQPHIRRSPAPLTLRLQAASPAPQVNRLSTSPAPSPSSPVYRAAQAFLCCHDKEETEVRKAEAAIPARSPLFS